MAQHLSTEADIISSAVETKERTKTEKPEISEDIGKCNDMENTRKIKKKSFSDMKQKMSSKSLFGNLFNRKKVNFEKKSQYQFIRFVFLRKMSQKRQLKRTMEYQEILLQMKILVRL